jgi:hypothetical protein
MKVKGVFVTCLVVVMYLFLCSWRFERLDEVEEINDNQLVVNVK